MLAQSKNITAKTSASLLALLTSKLNDYSVLVKYRLNLTVVFSAAIGYCLAVGAAFAWGDLFWLGLGGFMVTGSANALNQILEKDYDKLMKRTANRPLAAGRMGIPEAVLVAGISGISGIGLLWYFFNAAAAVLGAMSLLAYAFVYTPLKRFSPIAILVGAVPGALPPAIGWVAATGHVGLEAWALFAMQFLWQFPHFWAIGWLGAEEYGKAGYRIINVSDRNANLALQILLYIFGVIAVSFVPVWLNMASVLTVAAVLLTGSLFVFTGVNLLRQCSEKAALKVMFASIVYLMVVQSAMVMDRLFVM